MAAITALLMSGCKMIILDPKGMIGHQEKNLMIIAVVLMLIVVIPVFILTFVFAWKYRASNEKARYTPDWDHNTMLEVVWWGIPIAIIAILATITWTSTHRLDPYRPLNVEGKPLTIQAVALDWKWLFIYPEQGIASVNFVQLPLNVPVAFKVSADAPMNAFWIPQLGGQIYAMTGMQSTIHLIANHPGDYAGLSANFSGPGFSDMKFIARAGTDAEFNEWVSQVKHSPLKLTIPAYNQLMRQSINNPVAFYSYVEPGLFKKIIMKFMMPTHDGLEIPHATMSSHY